MLVLGVDLYTLTAFGVGRNTVILHQKQQESLLRPVH